MEKERRGRQVRPRNVIAVSTPLSICDVDSIYSAWLRCIGDPFSGCQGCVAKITPNHRIKTYLCVYDAAVTNPTYEQWFIVTAAFWHQCITSGEVALTPSMPAVPNCCCSKGSAPYWSNPLFLIFDIRALWRSVLSARAPKCQKLKMVG